MFKYAIILEIVAIQFLEILFLKQINNIISNIQCLVGIMLNRRLTINHIFILTFGLNYSGGNYSNKVKGEKLLCMFTRTFGKIGKLGY